MNAGIVILQDGTPCIVYDEPLPHPVHHVEFNAENYQISFVYDVEPKEKKTFEYPLDHPFVELLKENGIVAIALTENEQLVDIQMISIIFIAE